MITRTYSYLPTGNINLRSGTSYNYNAQGTPCAGNEGGGPHAVCSVTGTVNGYTNPTFTYDRNGNLKTGLGRTLNYMSFDMPSTVTAPNNLVPGTSVTYTYVYNAEHERTKHIVVRTDGTFTTTYLHPAGKGALLYEKEVKPTVTEHKHYITAGAIQIGVYLTRSDSTTEMRYFHSDHLGSLTLITNASGAVLERLAYDAFGKRRYPAGTDDPNNGLYGIKTDRGFTGHEHLDEIALIHMNGRVYDPVLGRFMTADPQIQFAGDLQSYNRYSYAHNNPLGYVDPTGYGIGSFVRKIFKPVAIAAVVYFTAGAASGLLISSATSSFIAGGGGLSAFVTLGGAAGTLTALGSAVSLAAAGFTGGLLASGGDFQAALKGGAIGALTGGLASFLPSGSIGEMVGGGVNGFLQTGDLKGFARGFAAGAIPQDLGFSDAYTKSAAANIGIGIARDGIRGGIVAGNRDGIIRGIAIGQSTNAIGHVVGITTGTFNKFENGAFIYEQSALIAGSGPQGLTIGNVISFGNLRAAGASEILAHEYAHVGQGSWGPRIFPPTC